MISKLSPLFAAAVLWTFASWRPAPVMTVLQGKTENPQISSITLYAVSEGRKTEYATTKTGAGQTFGFAVPDLQEGFYYVADNVKKRPHRIYLKPGDQLTLSLNDSTLLQTGGSPESRLVREWELLSREIKAPAFEFMSRGPETYENYFPVLTAFLPKAEAFKKKLNTPGREFNSLMKMLVDADVEHAALQFVFTPRTKHPSPQDYPAYYNTVLQPEKFCDGRLLKVGETEDMMRTYLLYCMVKEKPDVKGNAMLAWSTAKICNDTLKGVFIANGLSRYKSFEALREAVAPVEKYLKTPAQKAAYLEAEKSLRTFAAGEAGYNFSYPDLSGKPVSLGDLKGKVVVVDMWATWCGPCKAEIPHLKKLEETMHGKDVAFVSISVDQNKDKEKWMDFVKKESLGGIQLFAGSPSEMMKFYSISGIPRFMVFDKQGKIVSVDSPRPSDPELKTMIEKTLSN